MPTRLIRGLSLAVFLCTAAAAQADGAADPRPFYGQFAGRGLAADPDLPRSAPLRIRDLDVTIRPAGEGFVVTWTTVLSHRNGAGAHLQRRTATHAFVPGPRDGWFRATESGEPLDGKPLVWARIDGDALVITVYAILEDGHSDLQIYTRKLAGERMELTYIRTHNNEPVAAVRGWLTRIGD